MLAIQDIAARMQALGFAIDSRFNLIAVRHVPSIGAGAAVIARHTQAGAFDDRLLLWEKSDGGVNQTIEWDVTTDPGTYWLEHPMRPNDGTAILVPGQHVDCWAVGYHKNDKKRPALIQVGEVPVWRDNNRDDFVDWNPSDPGKVGYYGINVHDPGTANAFLNDYESAGCIVHSSRQNCWDMVGLCKTSGREFFTITLLQRDLKKNVWVD